MELLLAIAVIAVVLVLIVLFVAWRRRRSSPTLIAVDKGTDSGGGTDEVSR